MLIKINSSIPEIFTVSNVIDTDGKVLKFRNGIKYAELDEGNVSKLKEHKLDEVYSKIKIEYGAKKDLKKDKEEVDEINDKEILKQALKEEMQTLEDTLNEMKLEDIKVQYKEYLPTGKTLKDEIMKGIVENIYNEKLAEIEG